VKLPDLEETMSRRLTRPEETGDSALDPALAASFPASDPVAALEPAAERARIPPQRRVRVRVQTPKTEQKP